MPDPNPDPQPEPIKTPFDEIDTTLLDDDAVAKINTAKEQFLKTVQTNKELEEKWKKENTLARTFQSEADRVKAELMKVQTPQLQKQGDPYEERAAKFLQENGASAEEVQKGTKFYAKLLREATEQAKAEIGTDLGPLAGTVATQNATLQFQTAMQTTEAMQVPEVAQKVWDAVQAYVQQGQMPTAEWIANFAKIEYIDGGYHRQQQTQQNQNPSPFQNPPVNRPNQPPPSKFSFPGSGSISFQPIANTPIDPNAPRTALNSDTNNALQAVFSRMGTGLGKNGQGLYPKNFTPAKNKLGNIPLKG